MQSIEVSSNPYLVAINFGSAKVQLELLLNLLLSVYLMSVGTEDCRIQHLRFNGFI